MLTELNAGWVTGHLMYDVATYTRVNIEKTANSQVRLDARSDYSGLFADLPTFSEPNFLSERYSARAAGVSLLGARMGESRARSPGSFETESLNGAFSCSLEQKQKPETTKSDYYIIMWTSWGPGIVAFSTALSRARVGYWIWSSPTRCWTTGRLVLIQCWSVYQLIIIYG